MNQMVNIPILILNIYFKEDKYDRTYGKYDSIADKCLT